MRVVVCIEHRFSRTPDGAVWTQVAYDHSFWLRYLEVFDSVRVIARVRDVDQPPNGYIRVDGDRVSVAAVPFYQGPWQYLRRRKQVQIAVQQTIHAHDAVILRVGSQLANCLFPSLKRSGRPFAVEVLGDPWEVFSPGAVTHPLRPLFRWYFWSQLRKQCAHATVVSYVTEKALQKRYPARAANALTAGSGLMTDGHAPRTFAVSDVRLPDIAFSPTPPKRQSLESIRLVFVGSLAQLYKGPDVLLDAIAQCKQAGLKLYLTMIGDGKYRPQLQKRAVELGIVEEVLFRGQLPAGTAIRDELDKADIFVMPSRTEGLPRALLEAMARSLPCIATTVGGIPELVSSSDLVPPGAVDALAAKIIEISGSEVRRMEMAQRNYERALCYRDELLNDRRRSFFQAIQQQTNEWMAVGKVA